MASNYRMTKDSINDAINVLHDARYSILTAAAWAFEVPPRTLQ